MIAWVMGLCLSILMVPLAAQESPEAEAAEGAGPERPRIALVLSGGGARGGAHLGVIRVLEELRIPVDMIVGTSGGAIVGGLYAGGWSPPEIENWLDDMNWDVALADRLPRRNLPYREKADDDRFLFDLQIGLGDSGVELPRSLIQGRNLAFILEQATLRTAAIRRFDLLPIPFRAVATDLETAEKVVLKEGRLSRAIHASMAVPGIFEPVSVDGRLLVDGGLVDNLPVATAREMGADIVIAVNVGTRLKSRESLRDIFDISVQVTALIVDSNIQESLDRLTEQDVLIEPILKEIGSQDFPRTLEAARSGETAAREARKRLEPLSVDDEAYDDWLSGQRVTAPEIEELQAINFSGLDRLTEERLLALMESRPGSPTTINQLQGDIGRLQRLGEIESLDFQLVEREGGTELDLRVDERQDAAHHLRLGFEIFDEFDGGGQYNLRLGHSRPGINRLGGEWRNELQIGRTRAVRTEFYQPLTATERVFLSLPASHETEPMPVYRDGNRVGEVSFRESRASLDLGFRLGRHGELRMGPWRGRLGSEPRIGHDRVDSLDLDTGGWHLSLDYDRLDDPEWPSEGQLVEAEVEYHRPDMGADETLRTSQVRFAQYWPAGANRFLLAGEWAEADRPLPYQQQFEIGGPFSFPGYRRGELRGDRVATLRAVWFRKLASADVGRQAGSFFMGAGVAGGNAWEHGAGSSARDPSWGAQAFLGAGTPLGPVVAGVNRSDASETVFFLSLGIPIHRPRSDTSPW